MKERFLADRFIFVVFIWCAACTSCRVSHWHDNEYRKSYIFQTLLACACLGLVTSAHILNDPACFLSRLCVVCVRFIVILLVLNLFIVNIWMLMVIMDNRLDYLSTHGIIVRFGGNFVFNVVWTLNTILDSLRTIPKQTPRNHIIQT